MVCFAVCITLTIFFCQKFGPAEGNESWDGESCTSSQLLEAVCFANPFKDHILSHYLRLDISQIDAYPFKVVLMIAFHSTMNAINSPLDCTNSPSPAILQFLSTLLDFPSTYIARWFGTSAPSQAEDVCAKVKAMMFHCQTRAWCWSNSTPPPVPHAPQTKEWDLWKRAKVCFNTKINVAVIFSISFFSQHFVQVYYVTQKERVKMVLRIFLSRIYQLKWFTPLIPGWANSDDHKERTLIVSLTGKHWSGGGHGDRATGRPSLLSSDIAHAEVRPVRINEYLSLYLFLSWYLDIGFPLFFCWFLLSMFNFGWFFLFPFTYFFVDYLLLLVRADKSFQ